MKILDVPQSGSQANTVASRNRYGQYWRTRAVPTQPRTAAQVAQRSRLAVLSAGWAALSEAQRNAWDAYALAHPRTDSLGQSVTITGHQAYIGVNTLNLLAGAVVQSAVPTGAAVATPEVTVTVGTAAGLSVTINSEVTGDGVVIVKVSPPQSQGRNFCGDLRVVNTLSGPAALDPVLTAAQLTAKYGTLVAGQKFFVRVQTVDTGNASAPYDLAIVLT